MGFIRERHGALVVQQTARNHKLLADLLREITNHRLQTVRTSADWLLIRPSDLQRLIKPQNSGAKTHSGMQVVDLAAIDALPADTAHFHADLLSRSGQTVSYLSGREKAITVNQTAVVGSDLSSYQPVIANMGGGVALQIQSTLDRETQKAVVTVLSTFSVIKEPSAPIGVRAVATTQASTGRRVEVSEASASYRETDGIVQEFRSTMRLPLGVPVLVGSMTLEPNPRNMERLQLVLILRVQDAEQNIATAPR